MKIKKVLAAVLLLLFSACVDVPSDNQKQRKDPTNNVEKTKQEKSNQPQKSEERFVVEGWVINSHSEYLHTVVGFRTSDNKLLNLIFPGVHMQFGAGMHCRLTYHRLNDTGYLPEFVRKQKANYFYLDNVELLPDTLREQSGVKSPKKTKKGGQ